MADELSAKEAELVVLREELREKEVKMETIKTVLAEAQRELTKAQRDLEREKDLAKERRPAIQGPPQVGGYPCMSVCVKVQSVMVCDSVCGVCGVW